MKSMKIFLVAYRHDGSEWNVELPAYNLEDARHRLSKLALGRLEGEIVVKIPSALGPLASLAAIARNAFASLRA